MCPRPFDRTGIQGLEALGQQIAGLEDASAHHVIECCRERGRFPPSPHVCDDRGLPALEQETETLRRNCRQQRPTLAHPPGAPGNLETQLVDHGNKHPLGQRSGVKLRHLLRGAPVIASCIPIRLALPVWRPVPLGVLPGTPAYKARTNFLPASRSCPRRGGTPAFSRSRAAGARGPHWRLHPRPFSPSGVLRVRISAPRPSA
jgi:hypothetical protein